MNIICESCGSESTIFLNQDRVRAGVAFHCTTCHQDTIHTEVEPDDEKTQKEQWIKFEDHKEIVDKLKAEIAKLTPEPKQNNKACAMCGCEIRHNGTCWEHVGITMRHPAKPMHIAAAKGES